MAKKQLSIEFPPGFVSAINRRHNGADHDQKAIYRTFSDMKILKEDWDKWRTKLDNLNIFWEEKEVEKHFQESIWHNAHSRLKEIENMLKSIHRKMFNILTNFDGNGGESFSEFNCISVEEIYDDFKGKYIDNPSDINNPKEKKS